VHLSAELPLLHDGKHRVLYPASSKAGSDLQVCLHTLLSVQLHRTVTGCDRLNSTISRGVSHQLGFTLDFWGCRMGWRPAAWRSCA